MLARNAARPSAARIVFQLPPVINQRRGKRNKLNKRHNPENLKQKTGTDCLNDIFHRRLFPTIIRSLPLLRKRVMPAIKRI
jgi:hypothetical protein